MCFYTTWGGLKLNENQAQSTGLYFPAKAILVLSNIFLPPSVFIRIFVAVPVELGKRPASETLYIFSTC